MHMSRYQQRPYSQQVAALTAQRDALAQQLHTAIANNDAEMLVNGREAERLRILLQARARLKRLQSSGQASAEQIEKLRFTAALI